MREMKDSGVEWIGKIPKDWEIVPLTKQLDSIVDYRGKTPEKTEEGTFLVTAKNIKDGKICYELSKEYVREADYEEIMHRGIPQIGDILFTTEAPLGQMCYSARIFYGLGQGVSGMGRWRLQADKFLNFYIPIPPYDEQKKIADYITDKVNHIEVEIDKRNKLIKKYQEYKKSLIYEVVTGKKEV